MLTSLVTGERAARTGNAEMLDDLVGYEGIKRTFLRSGAKLLFGKSAKIIVSGEFGSTIMRPSE
jgi:hypothetical protein